MAGRHHTETQGCQGQPIPKGCRASILIGLVCAIGLQLTSQAEHAAQPARQQYAIVFVQVPAADRSVTKTQAPPALCKSLKDQSRIVALSVSGSLSILTPEFASAATPTVSSDGKRVLFAGKRKTHENWNIWEMDADGSNKRQITQEFGNCAEPRYLALSAVTPPEFADKVRWIAFTSDASNTYDELGEAPARELYVRNLEPVEGRGLYTRRTTFALSSVFSPLVLSDGRVLFTSHQPGGNTSGKFPLMVINWDGTGINLFYRNNAVATLNSMTCELPDHTLVFVESKQTSSEPGGQLARISFKRPLNSYQPLSSGAGRYCDPHVLPDGRMLVSYKAGKGSYGLYLFDLKAGAAGQRIYDDPKWDELEAAAIAPSPEPQGLLSAVVDSDNFGDLQCLNVYDSEMPEARQITKGAIKRVRFVEGVPYGKNEKVPERLVNRELFPLVKTRILGEAPVEADGSFLVRVPPDTPFFVQSLDRDGMALRTLRSWIWVRRGTSRGCVGCHENKELAPENRASQALIRLQQPSVVIPTEERRRIDFRRDVLTILNRRCASCHGAASPAGGLRLTPAETKNFNVAYETLLTIPSGPASARGGAHVTPGSARNSSLIQLLLGKTLIPGSGNHHPATGSTDAEMKTLIEWIDLGAAWEN